MNWEEFWNKIVSFFQDNVWNIVKFFSILIIGWILIWIIMGSLRRIFRYKKMDEVAAKFILAIIRFFLFLTLVLVLLAIIGVPISGITTSLSAAILAIGVALKEFLSNVASGLILVGSKKYKTGDYIIVAGVEGSIIDINFLFTSLKTPDSKLVTLPNSTMTGSPVTNLGAFPLRRVSFNFGVAYESDTALVAKVVTDVMKSNGKIYLDPMPSCRLKELNESSISFFATCWCDKEDYWDVYYYVMEHVFDEFKRNHIVIPYKQIELRERKDNVVMSPASSLPHRVEKVREASRRKLTYEELEGMSLKDIAREMKLEAERKENERKEKGSKKTSKKGSKKNPEKPKEE